MGAFSSILVPLDGSALATHALAHAQALMDATTRVLLLAVVREDPGHLPPEAEAMPAWGEPIEQLIAERTRSELERVAQEIEGRGYPRQTFSARVEVGDPAATILAVAQEAGVDLIAMTTHGRGAVGRALLGSVTDRVAQESPVPVLVVRPRDAVDPEQAAPIRRLVVPLDGSQLAESALPVATAIAQERGIPLVLVRAMPLDILYPDPTGIYVVPQGVYDDIAAMARLYLAKVVRRLTEAGLEVSTVVEWGSAFDVIGGAAEPDDLVVMTSHGRTGVKRWVLGSVAEKLVRGSACPVLMVPVRDGDQGVRTAV